MLSLEPYKLPLAAAPTRVLAALERGVQAAAFPSCREAAQLLGSSQPPADGAFRDASGRLLVTCVTDMPDVTPAMIDWWFGWHLPHSERYALWHPRAHLRARVAQDRSALADDRARYLGNVSYVDEYIGAALKKLAIAFVPASTFNLHDLDAQRATAICAYTSDRRLNSQGGCLIHYVLPTAHGAQMRSGFWMGDMRHHNAWLDRLSRGLLNQPRVRRWLLGDRIALDLLQHCGEEMNHLARFLPRLYRDVVAAA